MTEALLIVVVFLGTIVFAYLAQRGLLALLFRTIDRGTRE